MIPVPAPFGIGTTVSVRINQRPRRLEVVETAVGYSLCMYDMPIGNAYLVRLAYAYRSGANGEREPEVTRERLTIAHASKHERDRFAHSLLERSIGNIEDILWEIRPHSGRAGHLRCRLSFLQRKLAELSPKPAAEQPAPALATA